MIAKKLTTLMATAMLVVAAATAQAAETPDASAAPAEGTYTGRAPYVSFGGVYGIENTNVSGSLSDSGGYDLRLGYNIFDMFAAEIEWQSFLSFNHKAIEPITGNQEPSLEARMLSLNGRFSPLTGRIQPYGLMGLGWFNVQADRVSNYSHQSSFAMRWGLGVAAYLTERTGIAIEAAYILPLTGSLAGSDSFDLIPITASIFFRFK